MSRGVLIQGAVFGVLLGIAGHTVADWRFWLLMIGFAVLSSIPTKERA